MNRPDPIRRFWGGALMAVGGLIATLCGACTGLFVFGSGVQLLGRPQRLEDVFGMLMLVGIVGGLPTLIGFLTFRAGLKVYRRAAPLKPDQLAAFSDERAPPEA